MLCVGHTLPVCVPLLKPFAANLLLQVLTPSRFLNRRHQHRPQMLPQPLQALVAVDPSQQSASNQRLQRLVLHRSSPHKKHCSGHKGSCLRCPSQRCSCSCSKGQEGCSA